MNGGIETQNKREENLLSTNKQLKSSDECPLTPTSRSFRGTSLGTSEYMSRDTSPSSIVRNDEDTNNTESNRETHEPESGALDTITISDGRKAASNLLRELPKPSNGTGSMSSGHTEFPGLVGRRRHTSPHLMKAQQTSGSLPVKSSVDLERPFYGGRANTSKHHRYLHGEHEDFRSSIDLPSLRKNSLQGAEMIKMRNSILQKRNMHKLKRELEDENIIVGNKISEGHENFVMAYNMLTGIRVAVSRCSGVMKKLSDDDFKSAKKLTFNMDGSELTPSSKYDFKFKDYSPEVFRELRSLFGIDPADYLMSITGKYILSELGSPGKSGSFFYYSRDFRFIIKTIHHSEHRQLRRMLKEYHQHVKENPNTLISQFYGLHRLKVHGRIEKVHFIVMNNLFPPHRDIHLKYDLKGSTWGRYTTIGPEHSDKLDLSQYTLKDLNWLERQEKIMFGPKKKVAIVHQLEADIKLLKRVNVMDYSLLLGIHDVRKGNHSKTKLSVFDPKSNVKADVIKTSPRDINREADLPSNVFPGRSKYIFYGHDGGIRATSEQNEPLPQIYYLGIIDCLTNYSLKKKLETLWRSFNHKRETISAVPARQYGDRFLGFIKQGISLGKLKGD